MESEPTRLDDMLHITHTGFFRLRYPGLLKKAGLADRTARRQYGSSARIELAIAI